MALAMRAVGALVLIILLCAGDLPFGALTGISSAAGPPPVGDWVIAQNTNISDSGIYMDGNITVKAGARLELRNVSLGFCFTATKNCGILVEASASLLMVNSFYNYANNKQAFFVVNGSLELESSRLERIGPYRGKGGLQLNGAQCRLSSTTIQPSSGVDTIFCNASYLDARNCPFSMSRGIVANSATLDIFNCSFVGTSYGIVANFSSVNITDSFFFESPYGGCELSWCSARIQGCDFGDGAPTHLPTGGPVGYPLPNTLVKDCTFTSNGIGALMERSGDLGRTGFGLKIFNPDETLILNNSFQYLLYGVLIYTPYDVEVRSSQFAVPSGNTGVWASGFLKGKCLIEGNLLDGGGNPININSGGARIDNNTITMESYSSGGTAISCNGPVDILQNAIFDTNKTMTNGIRIMNLQPGELADISNNRIEGFEMGIYGGTCSGKIIINDNNISNSWNSAIRTSSETDINNNTISSTDNAIYFYDEGYSPSNPLSISKNIIRRVQRGIDANIRSSDIVISGNDIVSGSFSISISTINNENKPQYKNNITIVDNRITANETGILLYGVESIPANSSMARNYILGCFRGINMIDSRIDVGPNSFINISEWGIYAQDSTGDFSGAFGYFNASAPNACRLGRFWSLSLAVKYNINDPGDPQRWVAIDNYDIKIKDRDGVTVIDERMYRGLGLSLKEYKLSANGTRTDYNPYTITASEPKKGVGRSSLEMDSPKELELYLQKGPDIVAISLDMSHDAPFEGELVFFCATVYSNASYDPALQPVQNVSMRLVLDGNILSEQEISVLYPGITQSLSAAWAATPGWHNVSFVTFIRGNVTDVLPDNNILVRPLFVVGLPDGHITANGTNESLLLPPQCFYAWEPLNFSMAFNSSDPVTACRFDFGDGFSTDWQASTNASHAYYSAGVYNVRGWLATSLGAVSECSSSLRIVIYFPSTALELYADPDPAPSNRPVLFIARISSRMGNISNAIWQFGDGGYSFGNDGAVAGHSYSAPGNYTVTLTLNTAQGGTIVGHMHMRVLNSPPTASVRISPSSGDAMTVFSFLSESKDTDGMIAACRWDLGDGNISYSPQALHSYMGHGVYAVTLVVQDDQGNWSAPASFVVTVNNTPPAPRVRADRSAVARTMYIFDATGTSDIDDPPENLSFRWDFGDGATANGMNVSYTFKAAGNYIVTLTVDDGSGGSGSKSIMVNVPAGTAGQTGWMALAAMAAAAIAICAVVIAGIVAIRQKKGPDSKQGTRKNQKRPNNASSRTAPQSINNNNRTMNDRSK